MHALAYNFFNWFRRLAFAVSMRKQRIDTIRFKLYSSCPYKKEFYETLENIRSLQPQLEYQQRLTNLDNYNTLFSGYVRKGWGNRSVLSENIGKNGRFMIT